MAKILGWFDDRFLTVLNAIDNYHFEHDVRGAVCEIGVYCGASFVPLANCRRNGEVAIAIDCFDDQSANRTKSGVPPEGESLRNLFDATLRRENVGNVSVWQRDSRTIELPLMRSITGPVRLFSIDGDHSVEGTLHDLRLADTVCIDVAAIIVDDVFNQDWPSVGEAIGQWLDARTEQHNWRPVAIGYNKVVFVRAQFHKQYFDRLAPSAKKLSNWYGSKVAIFGPTYDSSVESSTLSETLQSPSDSA
jgi:Methyltransferase domain